MVILRWTHVQTPTADSPNATAQRARAIRAAMPPHGLFAGMQWRIAPAPFRLGQSTAREIEALGRILLQFYRAVNLLYRKSVAGKLPAWVAHWLDLGKPPQLIAWQRAAVFKQDLPRVIRPDLLITAEGLRCTELDSVPGGMGLTGWLNQTYAALDAGSPAAPVLGGAEGMLRGFASLFGDAPHVHVIVSDEAATYRPEMQWLAEQLGPRFAVHDASFSTFRTGDAVYRFFELFDLPNVLAAQQIMMQAQQKNIRVTPPFKPIFEEKMLFALLWNRHLQGFWRLELGDGFFARLRKLMPYTWLVDPSPMPPHAAIPELNLTDWQQLKSLSQKERELILKVSGFSERAWGARGVFLGSDLSHEAWARAVDAALTEFSRSPRVLQRFHKPALVETSWYDFTRNAAVPVRGRARLCPYYFVTGEGDSAQARLGGVLATVVPADKKIVHGMSDAVLAPCSA